MNTPIKKVISYFLILLVLFFTILALLGIWEVIYLHDILPKILKSMLMLFVASAIILFIYSVFMKDEASSERDK